MRVLLIAHGVYFEPTNGAARSIKTIMEWLADAGHACRAVTSGRFDQTPGAQIARHHDTLDVVVSRDASQPRQVARYSTGGVAVTAIETLHAGRLDRDHEGERQLDAAFNAEIDTWRPDVVFAYGAHAGVQRALARARATGSRTIYTVRAWGYWDRAWFAQADRVLLNSQFAARIHAERIGLRADWMASPFEWSKVLAPEEARGFVTFINPDAHKGAAQFARLADMLGGRRPDIPILIVGSGGDPADLPGAAELDLARHPQIMVSPAVADSRQIFALTKILLAPSSYAEPFGRVAAEAMINGIPPIVSDRGGLPDTVGSGGIVLPLPAWMGPEDRTVPSETEVEPWFDAVTRLWDDPAAYAQASAAARTAAHALYDEAEMRRRYEAYFTDPGPFAPVFAD